MLIKNVISAGNTRAGGNVSSEKSGGDFAQTLMNITEAQGGAGNIVRMFGTSPFIPQATPETIDVSLNSGMNMLLMRAQTSQVLTTGVYSGQAAVLQSGYSAQDPDNTGKDKPQNQSARVDVLPPYPMMVQPEVQVERDPGQTGVPVQPKEDSEDISPIQAGNSRIQTIVQPSLKEPVNHTFTASADNETIVTGLNQGKNVPESNNPIQTDGTLIPANKVALKTDAQAENTTTFAKSDAELMPQESKLDNQFDVHTELPSKNAFAESQVSNISANVQTVAERSPAMQKQKASQTGGSPTEWQNPGGDATFTQKADRADGEHSVLTAPSLSGNASTIKPENQPEGVSEKTTAVRDEKLPVFSAVSEKSVHTGNQGSQNGTRSGTDDGTKEPYPQVGNNVNAVHMDVKPFSVSAVENSVGEPAVDKSAITRQITDAVQTAIESNRSEMRVHLSPENLGGINIKIVSQGGTLSLQITADNHHTSEMLASSLDSLHKSLNENGVNMSKVEVFSPASESFQHSAQQQSQEKYEKEKYPVWVYTSNHQDGSQEDEITTGAMNIFA